MKIKKIQLTTMILLIAFTTTTCSITKKAIDPVTIHFQVTTMKSNLNEDPIAKIYLVAAENFHKLNPQITVQIDYMPESTELKFMMRDIIKRLEDNETMDIVPLGGVGDLPTIDNKGLLWDLNPFLSESKEIDINQRILDSVMINGKLLVLPYGATPSVVIYNKGLFDAAHIPYPKGDWTWEQFREISKKIKPTSGYGAELINDPFTFNTIMAGAQKGLLSSNGETAVGYLDSPEAVRTLQWLKSFQLDDKLNMDPMKSTGLFNNNKIGMFLLNAGDVFNLEGDAKNNIGIAPLPHFEGVQRANPIVFSGFGISQKSKNPKEAWDFIKYLALTKNESTMKLADYYITTSKSISEATNQSSDPIRSIYLDELNYAIKPSSDNNPFFSKAWNEDLTAQFQKLLSANSNDIPAKLHDLALKLDQEMKRLKHAEDQQIESSSQ